MTPIAVHASLFLAVSLVVALATSLIKLQDPRSICGETVRFFGTVVVCIALFGVVVALLEWIFLRPLI